MTTIATIAARLEADYSKFDEGVNRAIEAIDRLEKKVDSTVSATEKKVSNAGASFSKFGTAASSAGRALTVGLTLPIVGAGVAVAKASIDFESAFAGVRKTVDATDEEFDVLEHGIRDMAKEMPASAVEIAGVAEAAGQLGVAKEDVLAFSEVMIKVGTTTNLASDEAATSFARLSNIMQIPIGQVGNLASVLVDLGNKGASTESEIMDLALRIAGAGRTVGLSADQVLGFANALASVGIPAEMGGSAISRTFITIADSVASGGKELDLFAKVAGQSVGDFRQSFQDDAAGATIAFIEGLKRVKDEGVNVFAVLDALGLGEQRVRDTLLRAMNAGDLFTESMNNASAAMQSTAAIDEEFSKRMSTAESKLKMLFNRLWDVAITLGDVLVPALLALLSAADPVFQIIEAGAQVFANMPAPVQAVVLGILALAAALGPLLMLAGSLASAWVSLIALNTALGGSFFAALGPIGLVILAVIALIAIFALLDINVEKLIKGMAQAVVNQFNFIVNEIKSLLSIFSNFIKLVSAVFHGDWSKAWEAAKDIAFAYLRQITLLPRLFLNALWEGGKALGASLGDGVKSTMIDAINWVIGKLNWLIGKVNSIKLPFGIGGLGIGDLGQIEDVTNNVGDSASDATVKFDAFAWAMDQSGESADNAAGDFSDLGSSAGGAGDSASKAAEKVNILEDGIISWSEALDNNYTPAQAGAIEAIDDEIKSVNAAAEAAFDFEKQLSKIAVAFDRSEQAAQRMVLALAKESLEKTKAAISAVFGGPTKETAALELQLAELSRSALMLDHALSPQIEALQNQIDQVRDAAAEQKDAIADQIDAIKDEAAERKKSLQKSLDLFKDDQAARKKALQRQLEDLRDTSPKTDAAKKTKDNQVDALEDRIRALDDATDAEVKRRESAIESIDEATDRQVKALEAQRDSLENSTKMQEAALQRQLDGLNAQLAAYDKQTAAVQYQIDLYAANADILQKQITAADATLLTEAERQQKGLELLAQMSEESTAVRDLSAAIGVDLIPEMDAARLAHQHLTETLRVLNDAAFRGSLIPTIIGPDGTVMAFDAAAEHAKILADAAQAGADAINGGAGSLVDAMNGAAGGVRDAAIDFKSSVQALPAAMADIPTPPNPPLATDVWSSATSYPEPKAAGGPVMAGETYLVGEKGPELFTANSSGHITPNDQINSGGQGTTVYNYGPIYAGDEHEAERSLRDIGDALSMRLSGVSP